MLSRSFKSGKCKTSLKLGISRIKLLKNRRDIQVKQLRRELAQLLETGQEQTARIRVEHVIREEKTMSAYDLIEIYCELIVARMPIIESQKNCPIDLKEAISSVIFASPRCADIPELTDARKQFVAKYGKEFVTSALELRPDCGVNRMIVEKLSAKTPDIETKIKILTAIAKEHEVKWDSKTFEEKLQEPKEDLLNGSSSFISANKMLMEPSNVNFSSNTSQSESASKIYQTDISSKPNSFQSSSQANLRTSPLVPTPAPNESRDSDGKASTTEVKDSQPREKTASLKQPTWRMEFKDAASAAQVAAESAERASIAARAAAELATRGNFSRQNSNEPTGSSLHSSRDERPKRSVSSKLKGESDESVNMEYDQVKGFQGMKEEEHMLHRDELREEISRPGSFSDEGMDSQKDNARTFDGFRESFSRMEMGNKKNDDDGFVKRKVVVNYDRSASASSIGSLDNDAIWFPPTDNHQSGNHDNVGHNIHEIDAREKLFRDDSKEHDTRDYPTAVFDEYDPESTDDKENLFDSFDKKHNDQPSSIFDPSTSSINSSNFSSFHHESRPVTVEKVSSSKFDDSVPVAFDDSDGIISESDDDMSGSRQNGTAQNSSLLHERSGSGGDLNPTREELGPSSSTKAKPLLGSEEKNHLQTSPSHVVPKDFETSDELAGGGDFGLKFGRLTGGLRNRGYSHPPYTATSVVDSPASSLETLGSTKQIISPPDKPFTSSLIEDDDPSSPIIPRASTNLESDKAKGSLSEEDYNQGSRSNKPTSTDKSEEVTTGFSVKQPVSNQEKSRRYRGVDPNPSTLVPYDSTTSASEISAASEVINQKIYDEKQRTRAYKELSSQMSKTDFDSNDVEERDFPGNMDSQANTSSNTPFKLSRRTKDFTSKDRTNLPRSTGYSDMSNSKTEHRPSRRSYAPEPPSQTVDQATIIQVKHNRKLSKPNSLVESIPESSLHEEKKKTAEGISDPDTNSLSSGSNKPSDSGGGGTKLQETASQKASHVHPKLPDYETFAAHFQSLRSNRR